MLTLLTNYAWSYRIDLDLLMLKSIREPPYQPHNTILRGGIDRSKVQRINTRVGGGANNASLDAGDGGWLVSAQIEGGE